MRNQKHRNWLVLNGEKLGELEEKGVDMFWIYGVFYPAPDFEKHRELFERLELLWEEDGYEATDLLEEINNLNLVVENEQGQHQRIKDFKISEGWYEYRLIL